jgi:hypothetical protein
VFHQCPMFGGSPVGKTLLGPVSGSFQRTLVSLTETLGFVVGLVSNPFLWRILQSWEEARYCNAIETLLCIPRVAVFIFNQTLGNRHSSRPAALLGSVSKREAGIHI